MWPEPSVVSLRELREFYGIPDPLWGAFIETIGDPGEDMRVLAVIPPSIFRASATATALGGRRLTVVEGSQLGLLYRAENWVDLDPWNTTKPVEEKKEETTTTSPMRKLKFGSILDQQDEGEFVCETEEQRGVWYSNYVKKVGGMPEDHEDPSLEQVSALNKRLEMGLAPFVDFAIWSPYHKKISKFNKYQLPTSRRRHLYLEMGTWPSQLCSMAGIVPGGEIGVLDAGSYIVEWAVKVGVFHRATAQQVPYLLALDRRRREQGEAGPDGKDEHEGEDGCGQRSNGTAGLDTGKAMGSDLEHGFGQPRVLARTSSRTSTHMAGKGLERDLENASRGDSVFIFERRYDGSSPREGRDTRRGGEPREELIENQAGSSEEEENCRQNGTGRVEIFERRRKSWRRIKRRQVIRWGRRVLCLEQQQRVVCGSSSRRTLQREEGQTSPMHHMQKPRTPELQVPPKVEVLGLLEFLWKRSKQSGLLLKDFF